MKALKFGSVSLDGSVQQEGEKSTDGKSYVFYQ